MIETVDPALEPVAKLRRFVVKRVQVVGTPLFEGRRPSTSPESARPASPRQAKRSGARK